MKTSLRENTTIYDIYKQQSGVAAQQPDSLAGILGLNKTEDEKSKAPDLKPYPLNMVDEIIADGVLSVVNIDSIVKHAMQNPALRKKYLPILKEVSKVLPKIHKAMVEIGNKLDKIK